jgi:hypothetical protein
MNASTKIHVRPFANSDQYKATEIYRGVGIEVLYCYLVNPTMQGAQEETLGWRYFLPDASNWMYKLATLEEAFLKARETVDFRATARNAHCDQRAEACAADQHRGSKCRRRKRGCLASGTALSS